MARKKRLWIEPLNGLCNRLRAVDSALILARKHNYCLGMIWNLGSGMNTPFDRLFEPPLLMGRFWEWSSHSRVDGWRYRVRRRLLRFGGGRVFDQPDIDRVLVGDIRVEDLLLADNIYIRTASRFYGEPANYNDWRPVAHIREKVKSFIERYEGSDLVGVHLRRGDHRISRHHSSTEYFVARMRQELEQCTDTLFLVASDAPEEIVKLRLIFGDRILNRNPRTIDRGDPAATEDALIELLLLASTRKIIGSAGSSFSETAAEWGGIPLEIAQNTSKDILK